MEFSITLSLGEPLSINSDMNIQPDRSRLPAFMQGGGEMGRLTREYDWRATALGEPHSWPQSLKTTLGIILNSKFPMFLWWGPDLICFYNDAYRPSLGNNGKHPAILGMPAQEAWPEIWDFISPLIRQVRTGSEAIYHEDLLLPIFRNGRMEDVYWTFSYSPVPDESARVGGVLVTCNETTQKVQTLQGLKESERRFQNLIRDVAIGVIVLTGDDMRVEIANDAYGRLINRQVSDLIGRPLFDVIPEAAAEFAPIIRNVLISGESTVLKKHPFKVYDGYREINGYLDLIYQPYRGGSGQITGVIVLCHDVSDQVVAQREMETTLEQLRLSRESAQLGMFDMDLVKGTMEWDRRCRTLFGISHNDPVAYDDDFVRGLHPDDRQRVTTLISLLFNKVSGGEYDVEYRTIGVEDGRLRWVRAKGKVYFDSQDKPVRFIGSVLDITEQKINEQRKNDFIAMVSHELKTPLTSLMAYIQFLLRESQEGAGPDRHLLERATVQTRKMTTLINGFLNLSRFESGKLELQMESFYLDELIRQVIFEVSVGVENVEVTFPSCPQVKVIADREKIGSVLNNLLSNAIKYSSWPKKVLIRCDVASGSAVTSITDNGMGIKAEDIPHIFDRFYRVENQSTKDIAGFGIGLYLTAEIVRIHNGNIRVESEYGKGSTFHFTIPAMVDELTGVDA
jgi:two-component system sensor histidine kinase VicK